MQDIAQTGLDVCSLCIGVGVSEEVLRTPLPFATSEILGVRLMQMPFPVAKTRAQEKPSIGPSPLLRK
jgi:hypothetical protein